MTTTSEHDSSFFLFGSELIEVNCKLVLWCEESTSDILIGNPCPQKQSDRLSCCHCVVEKPPFMSVSLINMTQVTGSINT